MHREAPSFQRKFLQFSIAGLGNTGLAIPLSRAVAVTPQLSVTPVPLTPASIIGLGKWSEQIITVIDLGVALNLECQTHNCNILQSTFLVVKLAGENQVETVAWQILPDAQIVHLPAQLPVQDNLQLSSPACLACQYDHINLLLLDVDRLLLAGRVQGGILTMKDKLYSMSGESSCPG